MIPGTDLLLIAATAALVVVLAPGGAVLLERQHERAGVCGFSRQVVPGGLDRESGARTAIGSFPVVQAL